MELKEAIEECKKYTQDSFDIWAIPSSYECEELRIAINTVLEELNNRISKDELKNTLRKVQDYQLNYKDTVLFNIIMQEIFGETEWTNLENKE